MSTTRGTDVSKYEFQTMTIIVLLQGSDGRFSGKTKPRNVGIDQRKTQRIHAGGIFVPGSERWLRRRGATVSGARAASRTSGFK